MPPLFRSPLTGETHRLQPSLSPCPILSFPWLPLVLLSHDTEQDIVGQMMPTLLRPLEITERLKCRKRVSYTLKSGANTILYVYVKGINKTNQDSQLKYDREKKKRDKEMGDGQKMGSIKREQMGHEGVDNALA